MSESYSLYIDCGDDSVFPFEDGDPENRRYMKYQDHLFALAAKDARIAELEAALREMLRQFNIVRSIANEFTNGDAERAWRTAFALIPPIPLPPEDSEARP